MAFRFSLEAVLGYRRNLEEREELALEALFARRAAHLRDLHALRDAERKLIAFLQDTMRSATPAVEIQFSLLQRQGLHRQQKNCETQVEALACEIVQQRQRYQLARQRREIVESVRERQWRLYRLEQRRREQASLDEMHLLRRHRAH